MRSTARLWAAFVAGGTLLLVTSCTSNTADGPTTTTVVSMTVSPSVVDPSTPTSSSDVTSSPSAVDTSTAVSGSSDISPQEAADRAAIEAQWNQFWVVVLGAIRLPDSERESALSTVAVDPLKSDILAEIRDSDAKGLDRYGSMTPHIYWEQAINGADSAVMGDCQDASQSGVVNVSTGKRETVGVPDNNTRVAFQRGEDGIWRVEDIFYLVDKPC